MMPAPTASAADRRSCESVNASERFLLPRNVDYCQQYMHAYSARFAACADRLRAAAQAKWGKDVQVKRLIDIKTGEKSVVLGTTYKQQPLKYSILKSMSDDLNVLPQPINGQKLTGPDDVLFIEEEHQKCELVSSESIGHIVTGVPIAVLGSEGDDGRFYMEDHTFMLGAPQAPLPPSADSRKDACVLLLSGISFGAGEQEYRSVQAGRLLLDWLAGRLSSDVDAPAHVGRVVIAGNLISEKASDKSYSAKAKYLTRKTFSDSVDAVRQVDQFLNDLVQLVNVDIMPGANDMTSYLLPQRPFNHCMFPQARRFDSLHTLTNPADFALGDVRFVGTSGQNVTDAYLHGNAPEPLTVLEQMLDWHHIAPTAPDSLASYPFLDKDPFILDARPHVFFAGNQKQLDYRILESGADKTLALTLPSFAATGQCALVSLADLSVEVLEFNVS